MISFFKRNKYLILNILTLNFVIALMFWFLHRGRIVLLILSFIPFNLILFSIQIILATKQTKQILKMFSDHIDYLDKKYEK